MNQDMVTPGITVVVNALDDAIFYSGEDVDGFIVLLSYTVDGRKLSGGAIEDDPEHCEEGAWPSYFNRS
jgi:hypothetical protein